MVRAWFVSAVARATDPGCKCDTALVLVGEQGARKSTFYRVLAGEWFSDTAVDIENKDAMMQINGAWIYELGEIEHVSRALHLGRGGAQQRFVREGVLFRVLHDGLVGHPQPFEGAIEAAVERGQIFRADAQLHGLFDCENELVHVERLGDVLVHAEIDGGDRGLDTRRSGHQDEGHGGVEAPHRLEQREARDVGHAHVRDDGVVATSFDAQQGFMGVIDRLDSEACSPQHTAADTQKEIIVINDQHATREGGRHGGNSCTRLEQ
jgi:hypothetical protein